MNEPKYFFILANERTGSTATARLLAGHPEISMSNIDGRLFTNAFSWDGLFEKEFLSKGYFNPEELYSKLNESTLLTFLNFAAACRKKHIIDNPKCVGIKSTFYDSSEDCLENMIRVISKSSISVIHITRDYLESFISMLMLKKTGRSKDITEREKQETLNTRVRFTQEVFEQYSAGLERRNKMISSLSAQVPFLHLDYFELMNSFDLAATKIFNFLGVSCSNTALASSLLALDNIPKRLTQPPEYYIG